MQSGQGATLACVGPLWSKGTEWLPLQTPLPSRSWHCPPCWPAPSICSMLWVQWRTGHVPLPPLHLQEGISVRQKLWLGKCATNGFKIQSGHQTSPNQNLIQHHRERTQAPGWTFLVSSNGGHCHSPCASKRSAMLLPALNLNAWHIMIPCPNMTLCLDMISYSWHGLGSISEPPFSRWRFLSSFSVHMSLFTLMVGTMWPKLHGIPSHFISTVSMRRVCHTLRALSSASMSWIAWN